MRFGDKSAARAATVASRDTYVPTLHAMFPGRSGAGGQFQDQKADVHGP